MAASGVFKEMALAQGLPHTAALLVKTDGTSVEVAEGGFLPGLLVADPLGILARFEEHARRVAEAGVQMGKQIDPKRLLGGESAFHDAFAELVTVSWLTQVGTPTVAKQLEPAESLSGRPHEIDGTLSTAKTPSGVVWFDVKALRGQMNELVDRIQDEVSRELSEAGVSGKVSIHVKGSFEPSRIPGESKLAKEAGHKSLQERIIAAGVKLLPTAALGEEIELGVVAGCRIMAALRSEAPYRSGFWSGVQQAQAERKEFWQKLKQVPRAQPFLLVLVRTYAMSHKHVDMGDVLDEVLNGHSDEQPQNAVFGHATTEVHDDPAVPRSQLQCHLSAVYFIDEGRREARLYVNPHALHPLPSDVEAGLREVGKSHPDVSNG